MDATPVFDPILEDAREITNDEMGALGAEWLKAVAAGDAPAAVRIAQTGLVAEHYGATLKVLHMLADKLNRPDLTPTPRELDTLSALRVEAKEARDRSGYGG